MKYLRHIGLVSSLVIGGVLGGLMAPLTSEAVNASTPTITLKVEAGGQSTSNDFTVANGKLVIGSCPPGGPNYCYNINTYPTDSTMEFGPAGYKVRIMIDDNATAAQLLVSDYAGSASTSPTDAMQLTGIKFFPVPTGTWSATSSVAVTITMTVTNKFDAQPNTTANGTSTYYQYGMSIAGYFSGQTASASPLGDKFELFGKGVFVTTSAGANGSGQPKVLYNTNGNYNADETGTTSSANGILQNASACDELSATKSPLCFLAADPPATQKITFAGGQVSTYYPGSPSASPSSQKFACTNSLAAASKSVVDPNGTTRNYTDPSCQPTITQVHKFILQGPDFVGLTGSGHGGGLVCATENTGKLPLCDGSRKLSGSDIIQNWNDDLIKKTKTLLAGVPEGFPCSTLICNGNLIINVKMTPTSLVDKTFTFRADGARVEDFTLTVKAGTGSAEVPASFKQLITGRGKSDIVITPDYGTPDSPKWPRPDDNSFYQVDQITPTSDNGSTVVDQTAPNPDVVILSCAGGNKGPAIIHAINQDVSGSGDTVTLNVHIHNSQQFPAVCSQ